MIHSLGLDIEVWWYPTSREKVWGYQWITRNRLALDAGRLRIQISWYHS